jgi:hypothetical protein
MWRLPLLAFHSKLPLTRPSTVRYRSATSIFATLRHYKQLPMKLWNDHVVPYHVGRCRTRQLEIEAADQVRNGHVHFHVRQTIWLSALEGTSLIPRRSVHLLDA